MCVPLPRMILQFYSSFSFHHICAILYVRRVGDTLFVRLASTVEHFSVIAGFLDACDECCEPLLLDSRKCLQITNTFVYA